jgi:hypothetical protein
LVSIFDAQELELLISGLPDIDLDDLRAHTEYQGYKPTDPVISYFWAVLRGFSQEEKALFLQYVTGTSKVPSLPPTLSLIAVPGSFRWFPSPTRQSRSSIFLDS